MNLRSILVSTMTVATCAINAHAGTSLPYIGPQKMSCDVKMPTDADDVNGGYITDEDCKFIYVLPPVEGSIKFSSVSKTWDMMFCSSIDLIQNKINELVKRKEKEPMSSSAIAKTTLEIHQLRRNLKKFVGNDTVLTAAASAQLYWADLVSAYKQLNPDMNVAKMPLVAGIFSTALYNESNNDSSTNIVSGIKIHGIAIPDDFEGIENVPVPDYLKKISDQDETVSVFMGEGIGLNLMFNLRGACAFRENSQYAVTGTYTYFYPVQTKPFFRVEIEKEKLKSDILKVVKRKQGEGISAEDLYSNVKDSQSVIVTVNDGAFSEMGDGEKLEAYKEDLTKIVLENVLAVASTNMNAILSKATFNTTEQRSERLCRTRFGTIRSCHTRTYSIAISRIDWEKVSEELMSIIGNANAQADSYKTFYMEGMSAMFPKSIPNLSNKQIEKHGEKM